MEKIPVVEAAKELMTEARAWSVMKWLREKKKVRRIADEANAALDQLNLAVKDRWSGDLRTAYEGLSKRAGGNNKVRNQKDRTLSTHSEVVVIVKKVREADEEAQRARIDAEETFDNADRQLSTALAREGCRKAILSWELHEKAIQKAEALILTD